MAEPNDPTAATSDVTESSVDIKPRSRDVTDGFRRAPSRAMLRAVGMTDGDWDKPQVGVASSWNEVTPCNLSLDRLAKRAKDGVRQAGGFPIQFGTISVSDGISMGHEGMRGSLVSREVICDSVETVVFAERLDGFVGLAGCTSTQPLEIRAASKDPAPGGVKTESPHGDMPLYVLPQVVVTDADVAWAEESTDAQGRRAVSIRFSPKASPSRLRTSPGPRGRFRNIRKAAKLRRSSRFCGVRRSRRAGFRGPPSSIDPRVRARDRGSPECLSRPG